MATEAHCKKRQYGFFKGIVKNVIDPDKQGHIEIHVPTLSKKLFRAMPSHDLVTDFRIPPVGTLVWVSFQDGKSELPVWFWGWNKKGDLDLEIQDNYPSNVSLGPRLIKWGDMKILFSTADGNRKIELKDALETTSITIAPDDEVPIRLKADGNIVLESENGSIIMNANAVQETALGNKIITTPDSLKIEAGNSVEINAIQEFTVTANNLIRFFGSTAAEIGLEAGTIEADKRGLNSTGSETKLYHAIKVLIESVTNVFEATAKNEINAPTNEMNGSGSNTIESPKNTLKSTVLNVLDAPLNNYGGSSAVNPLVLGTQLLSMLSAVLPLLMGHTHPTPGGPSSPSFELVAGLPTHISNVPGLASTTNFGK